MLNLFLRWVLYALLIIFVSWFIPGIKVENFISAMFVCIVIALINTFIKPILLIVTLPVNIMTLGILTLVINALMLMLAGFIAPGFVVEGFFSAFFGSIVFSILAFGVNKL